MNIFTRNIPITLLFLLLAFTSKGVTAHFTADFTSGCAPLVVHFTNTSSGATTYSWDLGNGTTSPLTDVSGSYLTPGTYTVTLTATTGSSTSRYTMTITVIPAPIVSFTANDTDVCPGTPVTFTSTTVGGVPGPVTYLWSFGDGSTSTATRPVHNYVTPGRYTVTLYATNSSGCVSSLVLTNYIHVFTPPAPNFSVSSAYFCHAPGNAVFTNTSTGTGALTYLWSFGDGGTSTLPGPSHTYTAPGRYTVKLFVTDANGCTDSIVAPGMIYVSSLHAAFTFPSPVCANAPVTFTNTSTTHTSDSWDFGDGGTSTSGSPSHLYAAAGSYTVRLIIYDGMCYDTVSHTITIIPGPAASFVFTPVAPCPAPAAITFTGTVPPGASVTWLYGDGGTGAGTPSLHTYTSNGRDTVHMVVVDPSTGCRDTITNIVTINDLVASHSALPVSGCIPLTVNFIATALSPLVQVGGYPYPITAVSWNFGDGSAPGSGVTPSHTYTAVGVFKVVMTIVTANGCTATDTFSIMTGTPPVVTFTVTPLRVCYHRPVTFTPTIITGPCDSFVWHYGDGGVSYTTTPAPDPYVYTGPGTYTASMTPYYHGCPGPPYVFPLPIVIDPPKAIIKFTLICSPRTDVGFTDMSIGDDTHLWMFGDGTTSTASNPTHRYPAPTVYTVTLATYNAATGCRDTATQTIDLTPPSFTFTGRTGICVDQIDTFSAVVISGTAIHYYWSSAGYSLDTTSPVYIDSFHTRGLYTIRLVIQDALFCMDTLTRINYLTVARPSPHFTVVPPIGCAPLAAVFTDASTDAPGVTLTSFKWSFGDGTSASVGLPSVTHVYTAAGTYGIKEIVIDNLGCADSITDSAVTVYRPTAVFTSSTIYPCVNDRAFFANISPGIITHSFWMFGDGDTSTLTNPSHRYSAPGFYTVTLVVTDSHGCTDTSSIPNSAMVHKPTAAFAMSDTFTICPPKLVSFTNTSIGGFSYLWSMGDGTTSVFTNPSDLYVTPSLYTITLVVSDVFGCKDTTTQTFNLYGYAGALYYSPLTGCTPLTVNFHAFTHNVAHVIWDFADGTTSAASYSDSTSHTYTIPGAYVPKLILSDNTGCQNSSPGIDTIKVDAIIGGFTSEPFPVCEKGTMHYEDTSRGYWVPATSWLWTFTNGDTSSLKDPAYFYDHAGTYPVSVMVTDAWGCSKLVQQDVIVYPPPVITTDPDSIICVGDAATLKAYGGVSYTWAAPPTLSCTNCNPTYASPVVVTTYTVTGTDQNGCVNTNTVTVRLKTKTVSTGTGDAEICRGITVQLHDSGATKFTWIPAAGLSNDHIADPFANPDTTTKYMIIAQLASCDPDTNYVTVTVHPVPYVNAGPDEYIMEGTSVHLRAIGVNIDTYMWNNSSSLSCIDCANPVASPTANSTYIVNVATSYGCRSSDTVSVKLYCASAQVFLPNSFTPNGDGENDVFYPRGVGIIKVKNFRIYNRWGQLLFERVNFQLNDASQAWDGTYNGDVPRPDVYVYLLDATCDTGETVFLKGDVTIIH